MVALRLHKYELDVPQIGKAVELSDMDVTVEWWHVNYSSVWIEWKEKGKVIVETFPRNAVLCCEIQFTKSLKDAYKSKELI